MKLRMQTATYQMAREMYSLGVRDLELTVLPQQEMAVLTLADLSISQAFGHPGS